MITRSKKTKSLFQKAVSFLVMICMVWGVMVPMMAVPSSAAAPASYTNIATNSSASVSISTSGGAKYFKFIPTQSGTYKFYSGNRTGDPRGALLNASGAELVSNDDGGGNYNFSFNYDCTANTMYYIKAYMFGSSTGSYTLNVQTLSVTNPPQTPNAEVLEINAAGGTNYSLFNSGRTGSGTSTSSNLQVNNSYNNNGYDLYGEQGAARDTIQLGLSFAIGASTGELVRLSINAYDVDEISNFNGRCHERDYIYLVDETANTRTQLSGYLSGQDATWNTTVFSIDPSNFVVGHTYHFEMNVDCAAGCTTDWIVYVRTVSMEYHVDNVVPPHPTTGVENADLNASISSFGLVSVDLAANAYAEEAYTLEYKAVCSSNNSQYGGTEYGVTIPTYSETFSTTFQLETGALRGTYEITLFIKDTQGNVVATRTATASYGYSAVSYHPNGGSQNLPTDGTTYSDGDTVTVKFDYLPSLYGYVFLGWSPDRYATQPMYTENGTNTFTIGASDVTLYAIWAVDVCEHEWSETSRTDATCTTDGMVVNTCSLCGDDEEITLPKLGHDYVSGVCSRCGAAEPSADVWDGSIDTSWYNSTDMEFTIYTAEQLAGLAQLVNGGNTFNGKTIYLGNNIDLAGLEWTPIGKGSTSDGSNVTTLAFSGNFNGNGCYISGLNINATLLKRAGLFGALDNATVTMLGIKDANLTITQQYIVSGGVIAGTANNSTITKCDVSGNVSVTDTAVGNSRCASAGMIVGYTAGSVVIDSCIANGSVRGTMPNDWNAYVGGIVGHVAYNGGIATVSNTYFCGQVYAYGYLEGYAGGIVGAKFGTASINNCFVIADITSSDYRDAISPAVNGARPTTSNSYYSSSTSSALATSTSLSNFQSRSWIETNLGWDFDTVWEFRAGSDYPVLRGFDNNGGGVIPPVHEHSFGEWIVDREATCTDNGSKHTVCVGCGEIRTGYIPALGHDYESELTRAATCVLPGIMTYTCNHCEDSYIIYIYAEHNYEHTSRTDATCTEDGEDVYTCTICGDSYGIPIVGGHNYEAVIERVATANEDGLVRYTCSKCGDSYTETIPMRPDANVLLVQDRFPWSENNNVSLLTKMKADGYITDWDLTTTASFASVDLSQYGVILIANDQSTATYNQLARLADSLYAFAAAGGTVIYGACDNGWAGGNISHSLPEGVEKDNYYSRHNYIVDLDHLIVTGLLTDGKSLTNQLLYGNYCSHTAFDRSTLPADANVILQDANGDATLVEYGVGNGHVILSGLTWEFYYTRGAYDYRLNTTYTKNVYDDLVVYALSLVNPCDHAYDEGTVVPPTCTENGYTLHTCASCGATMKDQIVPAFGHTEGEWIVVLEPTTDAEGLKRKSCTACGETLMEETIPMIDAPIVRVDAPSDSVILGQTMTFSVAIEDCRLLKSMALVPIFDTDIFELVDARWTVAATMQNIEAGTLRAVSAWTSLTDVNTTVFTITLRAKALTDSTTVTFTALLQDNDGTVAASVVGKNVAVIECPHEHGTYTSIDDEYHAYVCDLCGDAQAMAHEYTNACDETCNACGHERVAPHVPSEAWSNDSESHWHVCEECGAQLHVAEHVYDDEADMTCNVCGYGRYLLGDVDHDGDRDSDDAVYLVSYLVFGEETYPVYQPLDFDGNGTVDSNDAIYLLYNTFFGDAEYPLSRG